MNNATRNVMKFVWILLTVLLAFLAGRGVIAATREADAISVIGDLAISGLLGWVAVVSWKRVRA